MAQMVVRNLESRVKDKIQRRARRHGRSMEEEVRDILRCVVDEEQGSPGGLGTDIARLFGRVGLEDNPAELRGQKLKPAELEP